MLNEKALEAALEVPVAGGRTAYMRAAITAYLSALLPEDAVGLVAKLNAGENDAPRDAASLIQSQAARITELEDTGRFLVDRLDEFDLTDDADEMCQAFIGHGEPAHERFRALLNGERKG